MFFTDRRQLSMKSLKEYISEKNWTDDVKTKWHPEEGLFTRKDPKYIADYLLKNSKDRKQAMSRLVFYMNRAGENLENKTVLDKAKSLLSENINEKLILNKDTFKNNYKYNINLLDKEFYNIEDLVKALNEYFEYDIKPIKVQYKDKIFRFSSISSSRYIMNPYFYIEFIDTNIKIGIRFGYNGQSKMLHPQIYNIRNKNDDVSLLLLNGYAFDGINFLKWLNNTVKERRKEITELFKLNDK